MVRKRARPGSAASKHSIITCPSLKSRPPIHQFSFYYLHLYVWCIEWCTAFHTALLPLLNKMSSISHPEHTVISLSYLIAFIVTRHTRTHTHTERARYCAMFRSEYLHRGCAFTTTSTASQTVHHWLKTNDYRKLFFSSFFFFSHEVTHLALRQADNNF